jgi:hypothetical protein
MVFCQNKLIVLNKEYPIYDNEDNIIGFTNKKDVAFITFQNIFDGSCYITLISGNYFGYSSLILNEKDIKRAKFIKNSDMLKKYLDKTAISKQEKGINYDKFNL